MLQFSRTMFAQSRDGTLDARWSEVHPTWRTPHWATLLIAALGVLLLISSLISVSIANVMKDSINIIGVQAAYYYGLAGLACAWHFRHRCLQSVSNMLTMLILPVLSAAALWWAAVLTIMTFDWPVILVAVGSLLLGLIPLVRSSRSALLIKA